MIKLTALEQQVLGMLLQGNDEVLSTLREQAKQVLVSSRKMTGVGFFTNFEVPAELPRLQNCTKLELGDVDGTANNIKDGIGFVLHIVDGALSMLEGYTYDEPWPDEVQGLNLKYSASSNRKL